jgi:DNA-binding SARP family transcriptional activator/tetratricopeptide (TPR) repeat protein
VYLFGPLRVASEERPLPLAAPPRTGPLLAYLALHRTPQDRRTVAGALWPDSDPDGARTNLRRHLHYLRQALPEAPGPGWLVTDGSRVGLHPEAALWVDVRAFEDAVAAGELDRAAALYTDHLLPELDDEWLLVERERLRDVLLDLLTALAERHLEDGRPSETLRVLDRLLREDPLREDAVRLAMRVRYAGGDRAGALATYERFAELLVAELGVEPMHQTRELFDALVRELEPPPESSRGGTGAPPQLPFVGRRDELEALGRHWSRARAGHGGLVILTGPAGIGKSRLLRRLAQRVEAEDGRALRGSTDDPEENPHQALAEALRPVAPLLAAAGRLDAAWQRVLAASLPGIAPHATRGDPLPTLPPERERARLFHAVGRAVLGLAGTRPLLLVLEDLQGAGEASVALLEHLTRRATGSRLLLVATYREDGLGPRHPLHAMRRRLEADGAVNVLALTGLDTQAIATALSRLDPGVSAPRAVAESLHAASAGNPLLISELLHEASRPEPGEDGRVRWSVRDLPRSDAGWSAHVPDGVRRRVATRLERLEDDARTLASAAAVVGVSFRLETVRDMLAWSEREALDALDALLDARLVRERRPGAFAFSHQLMREAIIGHLDPATRSRYHRRAAHALERTVAPAAAASTLARHLSLGGEPERAARYGFQAAREAMEAGAGTEARELAMWSLAQAREPELRLELLRLAEDAARRHGDRPQQRVLLDSMHALAQELGDQDAGFEAAARSVMLLRELGEREAEEEQLRAITQRAEASRRATWLARAALLRAGADLARGDSASAEQNLAEAVANARRADERRLSVAAACLGAHVAVAAGRLERARERLEAAARAGADLEPELMAEAVRATLHAAIGREAYEEALELSARLLELAAASGDRSLEAEAHQYRAVCAARLTRLAEAKAHYRLAERLYGELERPQGLAAVSLNRGILDLRLGDHAAATERLERAERLFAQLGDRRGEILCVLNGSSALLYGGRHEEARRFAQRALDLARDAGNELLAASALSNLGDAERHLGARREAIEHLCQALTIERRLGRDASLANALCELVLAYLDGGHLDQASSAADELALLLEKRDDELLHPQQAAWIVARVRHALGQEEAARALADRAVRHLKAMAATIEDGAARAAFLAMDFNREIAAAARGEPWPRPSRG